jgi:signal peptidase II
MSVIRRAGIISLTLAGCVGCDQSTKHAARLFLQGRETMSLLGGTVRLGYAENVGGFLGMGTTLPEHVRIALFLVLASFLVAALLVYTVAKRDIGVTTVSALTLVVGGGLGNIIDRIVNDGVVIDFLNVGVGPIRTGIFNVADMVILLGAALLLICLAGPRSRGDRTR